MEHGLDSPLSNLSDCTKNGVVSPIMANFPDGPVSQPKEDKINDLVKVNGKTTQDNPFEDETSCYSSESDALIIDETVPKKNSRKSKRKLLKLQNNSSPIKLSESEEISASVQPNNFNENTQTTSNNFSKTIEHKNSETPPPLPCDVPSLDSTNPELFSHHSNPFFNESLFDLLHQTKNEIDHSQTTKTLIKKPKPKLLLKESYSQYLGLQPAVQFKCPKCGKSGFESLVTLQDHFLQCNAVQSLQKSVGNDNVFGFKLTRKVFLCSACGTYYENWNLYMHMLEYHKRYICLYCLGMFSALNDLCQHIQSRHNFEPGIKNNLEEFYKTYNEPCYLVCCECNQQFNEGDNFIYHNCISKAKKVTKHMKQVIAPENHVTGDFGDISKDNSLEELKSDQVKEGKTMVDDFDDSNPTGIDKSTTNQNNNKEQIMSKNNSDCNNSDSENDSQEKSFEDDSENKLTNENLEAEVNGGESHQDSANSSDDNQEDRMDDLEDEGDELHEECEPVETRKVPKLSLKLPKPGLYPEPDPEESDDSEKLDMDFDNAESENENDRTASDQGDELEISENNKEPPKELHQEDELIPTTLQYPVAGPDIPVIEIELDQPLDKMDIRILLQKCLRATVRTCIYCNHSRRIAVNGRQLALHAMAEHRYSAINKSITEEELIPESFNLRIKECLEQLETVFFNLESGASDEAVTFSHVFECFQCQYSTSVHKELYLHNRKFHSKNLLLCIMCKSNFYSYSELICHLCPGVYVLDYDIHFRCCMCVSDDLPSSFRLMVHLRKRHNVCDVCLEMNHSQYKLSNHVWKHKLHHFCYRCGIAYRNKPDITRHLFWKHGTESVLCKKCLQKKWSHVYHFCVPPASFTCEECNLAFTKAVSLKVHKRLHTEEKKHACTWEDCSESFISKKLMLKHLKWHTDPPEEAVVHEKAANEVETKVDEVTEEKKEPEEAVEIEEPPKPVKPKVDVYDLPELNLSESDSSDSEDEVSKTTELITASENNIANKPTEEQNLLALEQNSPLNKPPSDIIDETLPEVPEPEQAPVDDTSSSVMQEIWDNFKNYQANKEKMDNMLIGDVDSIKADQPYIPDIPIPEVEEGITWQMALRDHDYCADPVKSQSPDTIIEVKPSLEATESVDHDYCFQKENEKAANGTKPTSAIPSGTNLPAQLETIEPSSPSRKRTSSSSSSSSDSDSSCACGSSCSCSDSSSGSSSSSSDSSNSDSSTEEGRKRQQQRRLKRRERNKALKKSGKPKQVEKTETKVNVVTLVDQPVVPVEMPIHESDLETTESETDEEFYDREPQKFAKKILEEKRSQLLAEAGPNMVPNGSFIESTSRPPTPPVGSLEEEQQPKRKKKTKKRKKRKSEKKLPVEERTYSATLLMDTEVPAPPPSIPYYQQFHQTGNLSPTVAPITLSVSRNSPVRAPQTPPSFISSMDSSPKLAGRELTVSDSSVRSSKRRRVPNKFYGYSSDEDGDKPQSLKRSRMENNRTIPAPSSPMLVPPITIKTVPSPLTASPRPPTVEPITLRLPKPHVLTSNHKRRRPPPPPTPTVPPLRLSAPRIAIPPPKDDSGTESNDSDFDNLPTPQSAPRIMTEPSKALQPQLYCYCKCPYDEVSEMIGCDSNDCQIEWFHFECVGIMVPPKGQWFCPDCRKKKQQRSLLY